MRGPEGSGTVYVSDHLFLVVAEEGEQPLTESKR